MRRLRREPVGAPEFPLFSFDVARLLDELLVEVGVADLGPVTLTMRSEATLAFIRPRAEGRGGDLHVHSVLNRPDTPRPVIEHVLRHELIHLLVDASANLESLDSLLDRAPLVAPAVA